MLLEGLMFERVGLGPEPERDTVIDAVSASTTLCDRLGEIREDGVT